MKLVKAVAPYDRGNYLNFKMHPYQAWKKCAGQVAVSHYPWRKLHRFAYECELPTLFLNKQEARLRFVEPVSMNFDAFPDYMGYEIIPMMWDCWPRYHQKIAQWFKKYKVKTAIISSSINAEAIRRLCPDVNIMFCPEAIETSVYSGGKQLKDRDIDVLELGRTNKNVVNLDLPNTIQHQCTIVNGKFVFTNEELREAMGNSKITIALPRSITHPDSSGGVETMTQRYWEGMLTRQVMLGHAPEELINLVGYNPVVEIDFENANEQIADIISHIEDYQELVDKNRKTALELGDWTNRMSEVMLFLQKCGYKI